MHISMDRPSSAIVNANLSVWAGTSAACNSYTGSMGGAGQGAPHHPHPALRVKLDLHVNTNHHLQSKQAEGRL